MSLEVKNRLLRHSILAGDDRPLISASIRGVADASWYHALGELSGVYFEDFANIDAQETEYAPELWFWFLFEFRCVRADEALLVLLLVVFKDQFSFADLDFLDGDIHDVSSLCDINLCARLLLHLSSERCCIAVVIREMQEVDLPHLTHVICLQKIEKGLDAHVRLDDALCQIKRDPLMLGIVNDDLLRVVCLDHDVGEACECVSHICAVCDVYEFFARLLRRDLISETWYVMLCLKRQDAECADPVILESLQLLYTRIKLCNVSVAVDRDSALQELWDCHCVIAVPVCYKAGVNAARLEAASDLDALEGDACIQE
nr:MAG TPA: hypothetical protein [Caudoviricetes sp.]